MMKFPTEDASFFLLFFFLGRWGGVGLSSFPIFFFFSPSLIFPHRSISAVVWMPLLLRLPLPAAALSLMLKEEPGVPASLGFFHLGSPLTISSSRRAFPSCVLPLNAGVLPHSRPSSGSSLVSTFPFTEVFVAEEFLPAFFYYYFSFSLPWLFNLEGWLEVSKCLTKWCL